MSDVPALDRRVTPARPDLAARRLEGVVAADRYVDGTPRRVAAASVPLHRAPRFDAPLDSEALAGDLVTVYEETIEGWAWGELSRDGYVGYLPADALGPAEPAPTHRVAALRTFRYPGPDLKLPALGPLSMGAALVVVREEERRGTRYAVLADGTAVIARHLEPEGTRAADFVAVAERLVYTPYLWGGATTLGLDCSGLVQLSLRMAGIACPRDSDQQEAALGEPLPLAAAPQDGRRSGLTRGDLLFWPGHVGIMLDDARLLHASGFHMEVVIEPVTEALARIAAAGSELRSVRRMSGIGLPVTDEADRHFFRALAWRITDVLKGSPDAATRHLAVDDILPDRRSLGEGELELPAVAFMLGGKAERFSAALEFTPQTAAAFREGRRSIAFADDDPATWFALEADKRRLVVTVHR